MASQTATHQGPPHPSLVLVKDMKPLQKNFDCKVIVLQAETEPFVTRDGAIVFKFLVADWTGSILFVVWEHSIGQCIKSGDILQLNGVDCGLRRGRLQLTSARSGRVRRVGQDTLLFSEKPNFSENQYQAPSVNPAINRNKTPQAAAMNPRMQPLANPPAPQSRFPRGGRGGRGGGRGGRRGLGFNDLDHPDTGHSNRSMPLPPPAPPNGHSQGRRDPRKRAIEAAEADTPQRSRRKVESNELDQTRPE